MQISLHSSRRRARAAFLLVTAAGLSACDATSPSGSVTTDQLRSVAVGMEQIFGQSIFLDLFGGSVLPAHGAAAPRHAAVQTRLLLEAAARGMEATVQAAEAFPADIKAKTFVPTNDGRWAWDPALGSPGPNRVRFIVRNNLGQTRGQLDVTDMQAPGSLLRYRAELATVNGLKVMDYVNEYSETFSGVDVSSYSYRVNGSIGDGQTTITFDYQISEAGMTTASPTGAESYTVQVPRLNAMLHLTGQGSAAGWSNDYTLTVRNSELRWVVAADNSIHLYRGTQHIATGTHSSLGSTMWRSPSNQLLDANTEAFVLAADRAGESMFAPVTVTLLVDELLFSAQP